MARGSTAALLAVALSLAPVSPAAAAEPAQPRFVGSDVCATCHQQTHALWRETLHANVIRDAKKDPSLILGDFSAEDLGFKKEEVLYTVGSHWDQRYMTRIEGELYVLPKLWAVQSRQWRPYNVWSWKQRPWTRYCAGCHVTGYVPGNGQYTEMRIGCESCHGPGSIHAASSAPADIVNPARLDPDRRDDICAACHVRGNDLSGNFYFPVGYLPGKNLGDYYVPIDVEEGEGNAGAIKRLYKAWALQREESGRGKCEVCGIYGSSDKIKEKAKLNDDVLGYCLKCHEFGDKLATHARHPKEANLVCLDCHRPKPFSNVKEKINVHSVRYYRIHQDSCYDEDVGSACIACHKHKDAKHEWAEGEIAAHWRVYKALDH